MSEGEKWQMAGIKGNTWRSNRLHCVIPTGIKPAGRAKKDNKEDADWRQKID
ncbi:MAG TPA: hypothetical protein VKF63_02965 [Terracidiphilus sp.]|nr:hypothetical protein [Terracidiphilus sp.]